ncbi:sulfite exporter TauE/SafE [Acetivibrio thermocellus AD2]|jgi:sulfite exporter TauE/SafE/copper chaperone CopZ|uniref:Sulfite exporter TauE/SafE n=1 Tax=Acetivibrio thermocellus AD2 TaxID=1138384 RepID=A0AB36TIY1_ACETH|nr:sulfite exporter TauE/SafE family protein [Acetivibrio thermocellus]ADU75545.1 Heavy metal transport/detoxification protein [Acetivibrio thermocellus DSM 1313]ALX09536.1 Heavy metal transport/detoxification protein [Acetivibrio thermocellus AD2]ANV77308.1 Heavy metal transport/detoxification protein [Acetivibrio thermocellus DSM 2360]EIC04474.1 Heavy metal transport/detoxification protein [Acetivibrio thermocellus YS]PFH03817.1 sulfite exporter TauE/SafE [Acetivibrio thermocellus AD2]
MKNNFTANKLYVQGMTCTGCETRIENVLRKLDGVTDVKASYTSSTVYVAYDKSKLNLDKIIETVEKLDYKIKGVEDEKNAGYDKRENFAPENGSKTETGQLLGIIIVFLAFLLIIKNGRVFNFIPEIDRSMSYGLLFVAGLLTSLHCVAMCGGINMSVCMQYKSAGGKSKALGSSDGKTGKAVEFEQLMPSFLYNLGRVISYTVVGGVVGALGSVISFSGAAKGVVAIISGVFMVIMGLNMLNIFPVLRKITPRMPKIFGRKISNAKNKGPLLVGLLNGFMPCGPLQAMQLYALGTGSFIAGATSMFMFSMGTVPLMFGLGAISSIAGGKFTQKMMRISAVLVIVLGVVMFNRGLSLSGYSFPIFYADSAKGASIARIEGDVQVVETQLEPGRYAPIVVQKGIPVKWTIKANKEDLNGCNNAIVAREFGIDNRKLEVGDNIIEFTPAREGEFVYSCWMGMIHGYIKVVNDINEIDQDDINLKNEGFNLNKILPKGCCGI